jgi:NAD(P)-dependent dehydrogenase (short-subunit alcohol dehydrogenase family)
MEREYESLDVVVTGGTGALGTAVASLLLARGARVHVPAFDDAEAERFALRGAPGVSVRAGVDLTDELHVERFYTQLPGLFASIHVAGGYAGGALLETAPAVARKMLTMNALSAFLCCREAVRRMRAEGRAASGGRIVNVSARPALVPTAGVSAYAMSKAAVAALTLSLSEELKGEGIWVNAIVPSVLDTPANRAGMPSADVDAWPKVEEAAETIAFLASPRNTSTRGALVPVYGRS